MAVIREQERKTMRILLMAVITFFFIIRVMIIMPEIIPVIIVTGIINTDNDYDHTLSSSTSPSLSTFGELE